MIERRKIDEDDFPLSCVDRIIMRGNYRGWIYWPFLAIFSFSIYINREIIIEIGIIVWTLEQIWIEAMETN